MARFGINPHHALGISVAKMRAIAREIGRDHDLALGLWAPGIHEARILATIVDGPELVSKEQMQSWVEDSTRGINWALRGIGKRNAHLKELAIASAERIRGQNTKSARWIANDALRELTSDGVKDRLRQAS